MAKVRSRRKIIDRLLRLIEAHGYNLKHSVDAVGNMEHDDQLAQFSEMQSVVGDLIVGLLKKKDKYQKWFAHSLTREANRAAEPTEAPEPKPTHYPEHFVKRLIDVADRAAQMLTSIGEEPSFSCDDWKHIELLERARELEEVVDPTYFVTFHAERGESSLSLSYADVVVTDDDVEIEAGEEIWSIDTEDVESFFEGGFFKPIDFTARSSGHTRTDSPFGVSVVEYAASVGMIAPPKVIHVKEDVTSY